MWVFQSLSSILGWLFNRCDQQQPPVRLQQQFIRPTDIRPAASTSIMSIMKLMPFGIDSFSSFFSRPVATSGRMLYWRCDVCVHLDGVNAVLNPWKDDYCNGFSCGHKGWTNNCQVAETAGPNSKFSGISTWLLIAHTGLCSADRMEGFTGRVPAEEA